MKNHNRKRLLITTFVAAMTLTPAAFAQGLLSPPAGLPTSGNAGLNSSISINSAGATNEQLSQGVDVNTQGSEAINSSVGAGMNSSSSVNAAGTCDSTGISSANGTAPNLAAPGGGRSC